jgi:hypothetical protein
MSLTKQDPAFDPDTEWLDHVQPTGLVVAKAILKELGLTPVRQTALDSEAVTEHLAAQGPTVGDPWAFFQRLLGWPASHVAGAPDGPTLPPSLSVSLPEQDTLLAPTWAVKAAAGEGFQLLAQILPAGIDPDQRGALDGWEASAHQRFERLLRETGVLVGVLLSDHTLRLAYAPVGETSGWLSFPLRQLKTVAGRPMLGGLKLLLGAPSLFTNPENKRLPALLRRSREAQASVSQELARQVLGALHELLRGLHAADRARVERLARQQSSHLYEGLLTVLLRLVFLLYAEDRDLLPSRTDAESRELYDRNYSVRLLLARLADDEVQNPDTMDERIGAWGRLLALFRLVHRGDGSGWIVARGGKLFDPDAFPFLEGRDAVGEAPSVLPLSDGCVLRLLRGLMTLRGERLSYRTLDVEQIGSVYETVMGFTVQMASGSSLAIRAGKNNRTPVFVDCEKLAKLTPDARQREIKEATGRAQLPAKTAAALKAAKDKAAIAVALADIVDARGSPDHAPVRAGTPILQPTDERRRTGSHYTPRSLTEPIVRQALAPALERLGTDATPAQILELKVCDPAMGSGAFLVEACRQLGERLVRAWTHPGPKPVIPADEDEDLHARRLVAQRCLYGVDKNPMATDLARLSLWLATLARDHEFTFLDHALKAGDSLVGLTRAQIAALHWEAGPEHAVMRYMVRDKLKDVLDGRNQIRDAPDDVSRAIQEQRHRQAESAVQRMRNTGDAVIAAFFSTDKTKARETRRAEIESWFAGGGNGLWDRVDLAAAELQQGAHPLRPFHWELEFPEVFEGDNPGFDLIVGNPPFMGGGRVSSLLGYPYVYWLANLHEETHGNGDLVAHFFRRSFSLLRSGGVFGLIATKTIGQGDTRATGLRWICQHGGVIFAARRRVRWPGGAAVLVSMVHISKGPKFGTATLDGRQVERITAFLFHRGVDEDPVRLQANANRCFLGTKVYEQGFTFDDADGKGLASSIDEMKRLVSKDSRNAARIFPYIGGDEINTNPTHAHHRYVINFGEMSETEARHWPDLMAIVERKVKPERMANNREMRKKYWWRFGETTPALFTAMARVDRVLTISRVTKHLAFAYLPSNMVIGERLYVFPDSATNLFCLLQSRVHELWALFFGSTLEDRPVYTPSRCFETFPFPDAWQTNQSLNEAGKAYYKFRAALMASSGEGLTKIYNRFHDPNEHNSAIVTLRELHAEIDHAVLKAYGWKDISSKCEFFLDDEIDDDEDADAKKTWRYRWLDDDREEVLARLLDLNAKRAAIEAAAGAVTAKSAPKLKKERKNKGPSEKQQPLL